MKPPTHIYKANLLGDNRSFLPFSQLVFSRAPILFRFREAFDLKAVTKEAMQQTKEAMQSTKEAFTAEASQKGVGIDDGKPKLDFRLG